MLDMLRMGSEIVFTDGRRVSGRFFLERSTSRGMEPQSLLELLNSSRRFLPFESPTGEVILLQKESVALAIAPADRSTSCPACSRVYPITVDMITGQSIQGTISQDLPDIYPRLSDFLNFSDLFFVLRVEAQDYHLNSRAIRCVRQHT